MAAAGAQNHTRFLHRSTPPPSVRQDRGGGKKRGAKNARLFHRQWWVLHDADPALTGQITCDSAFGRGSPLTVLAGPKMTKLSTARTQTPTPP